MTPSIAHHPILAALPLLPAFQRAEAADLSSEVNPDQLYF